MLSVWSVILVVTLVLAIGYLFGYHIPLANLVKHLPGPVSYPLIGNIEFIKFRYDIISYFHKYSKLYPGISKVWFGPKLIIALSDAELIRKVLNSQQMLKKPPIFYDVIGLPYGLVGADCETWRVHRKIINPTFNPKMLKSFFSIFVEKTDQMIKSISKRVGDGEFDLLAETIQCSMATVFETTMGHDGLTTKEINDTTQVLHKVADCIGYRMFNPHLLLETFYKFSQRYKEEMALRDSGRQIVSRVIQARKQQHQNASEQSDPEAEQECFKPQIFIDQLISHGQLRDEEIHDESYTMVAGGSETTALTVAFACLLVAMYPETQDKLIKEIDDFWSRADAKIDPESLNKLLYLDMVVKETLRLTASIPIIARTPLSDFDLGPVVVKPGMIVLINIFSLHRSTKYWGADAEMFRPERFAPECVDSINPNAFIPFSVGIRNCVGQRYAMLSIKIMMVYLMRHYRFSTRLKLEDLTFSFTIAMKLNNKHLVRVARR